MNMAFFITNKPFTASVRMAIPMDLMALVWDPAALSTRANGMET
ncbi:hypothetical protein pah_c050o074 [Parachlamydia acanthamoebae str. Hall's coccus]|nr:hypothetical protein pah_c050o074 [Parachlamydia acanthamoebae str. Hall's coccus]